MERSWLLLVLLLVAGSASATTLAPRRCSSDTRAIAWVHPTFPSTVNQRAVRSVSVYVGIDTAGFAKVAEVIEVELAPSGHSTPSEDFSKALAAAAVSWRFPRQPSRCVMELKLPVRATGGWPNNSFKPKPLRGSA